MAVQTALEFLKGQLRTDALMKPRECIMKLLKIVMAGTLLVSTVAFAGLSYVGTHNVDINQEDRYATGLLASARFSDDPEEGIGCGVRHRLIDGELNSWGFCQASISPDIYVNCITYNADLIDKMAGLNHYSYVRFEWDDNGECTYFNFSTQSFQIPGKDDIKK